jgi:hypothetical protein
MAMNSTKKILYAVAGLLIVGGAAFLYSQSSSLQGVFRGFMGGGTPEVISTSFTSSTAEEASTNAATHANATQTYAEQASGYATDAETAYTNNNRDDLATAISNVAAAVSNAQIAATNAANDFAQARAFYETAYNDWKSAYDAVSTYETTENNALSDYYEAVYDADMANGEWESAKAMAYIIALEKVCEDGTTVSKSTCIATQTEQIATSIPLGTTFTICIGSSYDSNKSPYNYSTTCYNDYEDAVTAEFPSIDSFPIDSNTSNTYNLDDLEAAYNQKLGTENTLYTAYIAAKTNRMNTEASRDTLATTLESVKTYKDAAYASANAAASSANDAVSSQNLAGSYQVLPCTSLSLDPSSYAMASTDTSAAFNLTAKVSTETSSTNGLNYTVPQDMATQAMDNRVTGTASPFGTQPITADTAVKTYDNPETVTSYSPVTYDVTGKWFGNLVFTSTGAGVFTVNTTTANPLTISKSDASDTSVSFRGGKSGDTITATTDYDTEACTTSFTITQTGAVTPTGATITQSSGTTAVIEGGTTTDSYTVALNTAPTANVSITLTPDAQVTVSPNTLTYTSSNWNIAQTVTVTAVNDTTIEGTHSGVITHTVTSTDTAYSGLSLSPVTVTVTDNDTAGAIITESSGSTTLAEGSTTTDSYTVVLNAAPTADVTVTVTPDTQVTVTPSTLTFTSSNWATAQTVTLTTVNDTTVEGTHSGVIKHTVSSTDTAYNGLSLASVTATITDDDTSTASSDTASSDTISTSTTCGTTLPFIDVATDNFAYDYINQLYCTGVVQGRSTTLFVPDGANGYVTYAELVKMIDIALLHKDDSDGTNLDVSFSNVHSDDWFRNYWAIAEEARVARSYDSFAYAIDPNANIPREVVALYVARALGATASNFTAPFSDVTDLTDPYAYAIYALSHLSVTVDGVSTTVITGVDSTHFNPTDFISRSEAATIVYRASLSDLAQ